MTVAADVRAGHAVRLGWATGWFGQDDRCRCRAPVEQWMVPYRTGMKLPLKVGAGDAAATGIVIWVCTKCHTCAEGPVLQGQSKDSR